MAKNKVIHEPRQVLESQLLAALDDKDKVAIVADAEMLDDLIYCVLQSSRQGLRHPQIQQLANDLRQLRSEAFGEPKDG